MESFASLGLSEAIVRAVAEKGYTEPTPIQSEAIPAILAGHDLMAGAQTGTGKTAGFTLPILQRLSSTPPASLGASVRVLVLAPTRELAAQVEESVRLYGRYLPLSSMTLFGGVGINPQIERLRKPVDIVVATPGRLLDHVGQRTIDLSNVEILVLDEADRMLDMGFIRDIRKILALLPAQRQNLLFSATFSGEIRTLADGLLHQPKLIQVTPENATVDAIVQRAYAVDRERKRELLTKLILDHDWFQVLVFTRTKHGANRLAQQLTASDIPALAIHGNKSQSARTRALSEFKSGTLRVLVATDIAARGIDIKELPHVVNFDLPNVPEDYVHRIGRTGRAGSDGAAVSLICVDDAGLLRDIERFTGNAIQVDVIEGFEPDPNAKAEPIKGVRGAGGRNAGPAPARAANARPARRAPVAVAPLLGEDGQPLPAATGAGAGAGAGDASGGEEGLARPGRSARRRRGQRGRGVGAEATPATGEANPGGQAPAVRGPRPQGGQGQTARPARTRNGQAGAGGRAAAPRGQGGRGQQGQNAPRGNANGNVLRVETPHRSRYENGGQPLDNANRSPAVLAGGRDRPARGGFGGGRGRGSTPAVIDPSRPPAPSEIVAILQGKRPTMIDGIPEEDRRELGLGQRGNGNGHGNGNGGQKRQGQAPGKGRARGTGGARVAADRPLHERFPGLPRDED